MKYNVFTNTKNSKVRGASKNLNSTLQTIALSTLFFSVSFGQAPTSKYLSKAMSDYSLSENSEESKTGYYSVVKTFSIQRSLNEVWGFYNSVDTKLAWHSKNANFLLSYDKATGSYDSVQSASVNTLKVNKVFLLELCFLNAVKIPVIFQITTVDSIKKVIEFTYMKENKSNGFQRLEFTEANGITTIKHISYYRSGNKLRDVIIYPKFHIVAINDFHARIFQLLKNKVIPAIVPAKDVLLAGEDCCAEELIVSAE